MQSKYIFEVYTFLASNIGYTSNYNYCKKDYLRNILSSYTYGM